MGKTRKPAEKQSRSKGKVERIPDYLDETAVQHQRRLEKEAKHDRKHRLNR